jgi:hypothetical protein
MEDESVIAYMKYVARQNAAGTDVTAATIQVQANSLLFTVNAAAETVIGTYTGNSGADNEIVYADANIATVQNLLNTVNGYGAGMVAAGTTFNRWRAGLGDLRPGFVLGAGDGVAAAAANALLGENHAGLQMLLDASNAAVANIYAVGIPNVGTVRGEFPVYPDHFDSDYTSTTGGVVTRRRATQPARQEEHPTSEVQVLITNIHCAAVMTANDKRIRVYDINDNLIWAYYLAALNQPPTNVLSEDQPIEGPMGSPLFVELDSVSAGGLTTDLPMTVSGQILAA